MMSTQVTTLLRWMLFTVIFSIVIGAILTIAAFDEFDDVSEDGLTLVVLLLLIVPLLAWMAHKVYVNYFTSVIVNPLQDLSDGIQAVTAGVGDRIAIRNQDVLPDVVQLTNDINALIEKSSTDVEELKRLSTIRSEFLANVSHELRTPIFSVQGYLETLLDGAIDDPNVNRQFLEKALQNALRLNTLLADLIDISRIESGDLQLSFRHFNIADLLTDLVATVENRAKQHHVAITLNLADNDLIVFADRDRIAQVITNLLDNAIKYNIENGTVEVTATRSAGHIRIRIADSGIGIDSQHLERLFERFYRIDKERVRSVGGTGLGLAIVKHILEAHDSTISVSSKPMAGTTMTFELRSA